MNLGKSLKHRNDLNFNLFDHATNELKRGEYEVLSKKDSVHLLTSFIIMN
jgi:predicted DNA-binding protein